MTIKEKKQDIISSVEETNNESLIDELYNLLHAENEVEDFNINEMPSELQTKLFRAMEDYKQGRYITHEQMQTKITKWLSK